MDQRKWLILKQVTWSDHIILGSDRTEQLDEPLSSLQWFSVHTPITNLSQSKSLPVSHWYHVYKSSINNPDRSETSFFLKCSITLSLFIDYIGYSPLTGIVWHLYLSSLYCSTKSKLNAFSFLSHKAIALTRPQTGSKVTCRLQVYWVMQEVSSVFFTVCVIGDISHLRSFSSQRLAAHQLAPQPVVTVTTSLLRIFPVALVHRAFTWFCCPGSVWRCGRIQITQRSVTCCSSATTATPPEFTMTSTSQRCLSLKRQQVRTSIISYKQGSGLTKQS